MFSFTIFAKILQSFEMLFNPVLKSSFQFFFFNFSNTRGALIFKLIFNGDSTWVISIFENYFDSWILDNI